MNLSPTSGVARMMLPKSLIGMTIGEVEAERADIRIILIRRGNFLLARPSGDTKLLAGDAILVAGLDAAIDAFADR
jgi:Trk K+ transport system NAD-binding subunit